MSNPDQRSKVTVEDLLHLKRMERPAKDFWVNFEREMRQKQLSALVEKRAWWHALPQIFGRRVYLPIGATAILAFTLVSVKYSSPLQVVQAVSEPVNVLPTVVSSYQADSAPSVASSNSFSSQLINRSEQTMVGVTEPSAASASMKAMDAAISQEPRSSDFTVKDSPSARSIAANLAHLEQSEPELINSVLGSRLSLPARVQSASAPVAELASLSSNSASKRNRLLAHYGDRQIETEPTSTEAVRERLSRRLADSDFNDHFSRIGLKGNRVSLKF